MVVYYASAGLTRKGETVSKKVAILVVLVMLLRTISLALAHSVAVTKKLRPS